VTFTLFSWHADRPAEEDKPSRPWACSAGHDEARWFGKAGEYACWMCGREDAIPLSNLWF
jgi:hypothetical protein